MGQRGKVYEKGVQLLFPKSSSLRGTSLVVIYYVSKSKVGDRRRVWPKAHFSIVTTLRCGGGYYSIPWIAPQILIRTL